MKGILVVLVLVCEIEAFLEVVSGEFLNMFNFNSENGRSAKQSSGLA
jgi:hypothetical protein